jgi:hypothetical protein
MTLKPIGLIAFAALAFSVSVIHAENSAKAEATQSGKSGSKSPADFNGEFKCGQGLKTTFANGAGNVGGSTAAISPNLVLTPATRNGVRGYYAITDSKGAEFHPFNEGLAAHNIAGIKTFYVTMNDPVTKKPMTVDMDSSESEGQHIEIFNLEEDNGKFLKLIGEKPTTLPGDTVADATAHSDLAQAYSAEIRQAAQFVGMSAHAPREATMHMIDVDSAGNVHVESRVVHPYQASESDLVGVLDGIVCGCQGVPELAQPLADLLKSPQVQPYKDKLSCNLVSMIFLPQPQAWQGNFGTLSL